MRVTGDPDPESIAEAIQAYAQQAAGTTADLDEALENASIKHLGSTETREDCSEARGLLGPARAPIGIAQVQLPD